MKEHTSLILSKDFKIEVINSFKWLCIREKSHLNGVKIAMFFRKITKIAHRKLRPQTLVCETQTNPSFEFKLPPSLAKSYLRLVMYLTFYLFDTAFQIMQSIFQK